MAESSLRKKGFAWAYNEDAVEAQPGYLGKAVTEREGIKLVIVWKTPGGLGKARPGMAAV